MDSHDTTLEAFRKLSPARREALLAAILREVLTVRSNPAPVATRGPAERPASQAERHEPGTGA